MLTRAAPVQSRPGTRELRERIRSLRLVEKAGVEPARAADLGVGYSNPEVFGVIEAGSIIGRMSLLRRVPFLVRLLAPTAASQGYWVGGTARAKPLSRFALEGSRLEPLTAATLIVLTDEAAKFEDPLTDQATRNDVARSVIERLDASFVDVNNLGVPDIEPASVTSSGEIINSTGDPAQDVTAQLEAFLGDLASSYYVSDPMTYARMALARDAGGSFTFGDLGPRGGTILGIPAIVSRGSPNDSSGGQLALIDASSIAVAIDGIDIAKAEGAALEMSDDPSDPSAATALVSLFQSNLIALRAVMHANWEVQRPGAVVTVTGAMYPAS